ncbi:MAG TPA: hypothetical protein VEL07_04520 [Planctomycetota bacterium]|nr:hypothetical protein [Planctomycetota bacterium]
MTRGERSAAGGSSAAARAAMVAGGAAGIYVLSFAVLYVDDVVIETRWFYHRLPEPMQRAIDVIYAPLIALVDVMGG